MSHEKNLLNELALAVIDRLHKENEQLKRDLSVKEMLIAEMQKRMELYERLLNK